MHVLWRASSSPPRSRSARTWSSRTSSARRFAANECDLMLAVGSTLSVYPIANVVPIARLPRGSRGHRQRRRHPVRRHRRRGHQQRHQRDLALPLPRRRRLRVSPRGSATRAHFRSARSPIGRSSSTSTSVHSRSSSGHSIPVGTRFGQECDQYRVVGLGDRSVGAVASLRPSEVAVHLPGEQDDRRRAGHRIADGVPVDMRDAHRGRGEACSLRRPSRTNPTRPQNRSASIALSSGSGRVRSSGTANTARSSVRTSVSHPSAGTPTELAVLVATEEVEDRAERRDRRGRRAWRQRGRRTGPGRGNPRWRRWRAVAPWAARLAPGPSGVKR